MSTVVRCQCGAGFKAPPKLLGKTVPCPTCQKPIRIPAANPAATKAPASKPTTPAKPATKRPSESKPAAQPGSIPVKCACGRAFQAPPSMAGKRARCPSCQGILSVPAPNQPEPDLSLLEEELDRALSAASRPNHSLAAAPATAPKQRGSSGWPMSAAAHWSAHYHDESGWKVFGTALVGLV